VFFHLQHSLHILPKDIALLLVIDAIAIAKGILYVLCRANIKWTRVIVDSLQESSNFLMSWQ